jgi:ligand-binding sensor domain-containing protein
MRSAGPVLKKHHALYHRLSRIFPFSPIIFTIFLIANLGPLQGWSQDYLYDKWGVKDGLPQNTVRQILQTRDGYLWIATEGGLARFDGVKFKTFDWENTPELLGNRINALFENSNGDLLIGSYKGGLTIYRNRRFYNMSDSLGMPLYSYHHFQLDSEGRLMCMAPEADKIIYKDASTYKNLAPGNILDKKGLVNIFSLGGTEHIFYRDSIRFRPDPHGENLSINKRKIITTSCAALAGNKAGNF